jgi:hypothetical protein
MLKADFQEVISTPVGAHQEGLEFLRGSGMMNDALRRLASDLEESGIEYSVIGAVALNQHGYRRFTEHIGVLLSAEGLERFREKLVGRGYRPAFDGARKRFRSAAENVPVEIVVAGEYPGDGRPKSVQFPNPSDQFEVVDGIRTITLEKLVELKLASGVTAPDRLKDLADVQELIRIKGLDEEYADGLDPSVRERFLELQQAVAHSPASDDVSPG